MRVTVLQSKPNSNTMVSDKETVFLFESLRTVFYFKHTHKPREMTSDSRTDSLPTLTLFS